MSDRRDHQSEEIKIFKAVLQLQHPDERVRHLSHAEAVIEVVERDGQIAAVDGADPVVEDVHVDVQRRVQTKFDEHPSHQYHQLNVITTCTITFIRWPLKQHNQAVELIQEIGRRARVITGDPKDVLISVAVRGTTKGERGLISKHVRHQLARCNQL